MYLLYCHYFLHFKDSILVLKQKENQSKSLSITSLLIDAELMKVTFMGLQPVSEKPI